MKVEEELTHIRLNLVSNNLTSTIEFRLNREKFSQRHIFDRLNSGQLYEPHLSKLLLRLLRKGDTFIDVGAHVGYFSILASALVENSGRVISCEPDVENFSHILGHAELNKQTNIVAQNLVVSDNDGSVAFYFNSDNDGGHALWDPGLHDFNKKSQLTVQKNSCDSIRIDTLFKKHGVKQCRLLKIDTEGAELSVLKSGENSFTPNKVPFVVSEINQFGLSKMHADLTELRQLMRRKGYSTFVFSKDDQIPVMVPDNTTIGSEFVYNMIFTTSEALGSAWPSITPYVD